jgi:hypothetical protein
VRAGTAFGSGGDDVGFAAPEPALAPGDEGETVDEIGFDGIGRIETSTIAGEMGFQLLGGFARDEERFRSDVVPRRVS